MGKVFKDKLDCVSNARLNCLRENDADHLRPVCPICREKMVFALYEDPECGWIRVWLCGCLSDGGSKDDDVSPPELRVWNDQMCKKRDALNKTLLEAGIDPIETPSNIEYDH